MCEKNCTSCHSSMLSECLRISNSGFEHSEVVGVCFSSGGSDMRERPCSRWPCTAASSCNEEHLDQLICANRQIMTMELRTVLNVRFSAIDTMLVTLEYCKVLPGGSHGCSHGHEDHWMYVCQDLLDCPTAPTAGADFYECSIQSFVHHWWKCIASSGDCVEQ